MQINAIVAMDKNNGIGINGKMPWDKSTGDLKFFANSTKGGVVVMGRKTYQSIPGVLAGRSVIVLTKDPTKLQLKEGENGVVVGSMGEAINAVLSATVLQVRTIWIAGGAEIYSMFLPYCQWIYITVIDGEYACDTFFPMDRCDIVPIQSFTYRDGNKLHQLFTKNDPQLLAFYDQLKPAWGIFDADGNQIAYLQYGTPTLAVFTIADHALQVLSNLPRDNGYYIRQRTIADIKNIPANPTIVSVVDTGTVVDK